MTLTVDELEIRLHEAESRLESTKAELSDLATMGTVVTSMLEQDTMLSVVMDMAIRLVRGEVGIIMLEEEGELQPKVTWGVDAEFAKSLMYVDETDLPSYCFRIRETIILNEMSITSEDGMRIDCIISVPIKTSERCHGVVLIVNKSTGVGYSEKDRESLEMLLNFVAVSIENNRLMKHRLRQQKQEQELAIAGQVQETIMPQDVDKIEGVEIGAAYYPAGEVGGDFYDIIKISDTRFMALLGDVSNKGVPAALVMSAAAGIIKSTLHAQPAIEVSELAGRLNNLLVHEIVKDKEMFITLFFADFDLKENRLTYCNAGHLPGLFWDDEQSKTIDLNEGGPIVGQFEGLEFKQGEVALHSGDRLFLFTDGLTEAEDASGNLFGRERAEQVFNVERGMTSKEFCSRVKQWIDNFQEGAAEDSHDDFTLLHVRMC